MMEIIQPKPKNSLQVNTKLLSCIVSASSRHGSLKPITDQSENDYASSFNSKRKKLDTSRSRLTQNKHIYNGRLIKPTNISHLKF